MLGRFCRTFALAGFILPCAAETIPVANAGFEDISGESPYNEFTFGPLNGWDLYDPGSVTDGGAGPDYYIGTLRPSFHPNGTPGEYENFPAGAPEGIRVGIAFNFQSTGGGGEYGFQQTLATTLQPHTTYTLQALVGNIASGWAQDGTFYNLDGFPGYRIDFLAGGLVLASDVNSLAGTIPEGEFGLSTVQFTTGADHAQLGLNLGIRLVNLNQVDPMFPGSDLEVDFDEISLTAVAVPEPSAFLLTAVGSLLLTLRTRGRRH